MTLDKATLESAFASVHGALERERDTLTALDQELGDGDLGLTMTNGFAAARAFLAEAADGTPAAELLTAVGYEMAEQVPSTMGTLVSYAVVKAGKAISGKAGLGAADGEAMLRAALEGIAARGKARRGEKTALDSLYPALEACRAAIGAGKDAFEAAAGAAEAGAEETKKMKSTYGKAAVFGEGSIGKKDPGAAAAAIILRGIADWRAALQRR